MRAFLAASPDALVREQIAAVQHRLRHIIANDRNAKVSWTKPNSIHLTFRFFAELDESLALPLHQAVTGAAAAAGALALPLSKIGAFPREMAPRVLWLGPSGDWHDSADGHRMTAFAAAIDRACADVGIGRDDKPWRPHLTIARVKEGERGLGRALAHARVFDQPVNAGELRVTQIALIRSEAGRGGHAHARIWNALLLPH